MGDAVLSGRDNFWTAADMCAVGKGKSYGGFFHDGLPVMGHAVADAAVCIDFYDNPSIRGKNAVVFGNKLIAEHAAYQKKSGF